MARALVVGCGCRGRALAGSLLAGGHAVRGTTRHEAGLEPIEFVGAEAVVADPARLATLIPHLEGVSLLCWLMGTAVGSAGDVSALHGPRLVSMLETIVDTPVRGVLYEASGSAERRVLERGAAIARQAGETHRMPVEVIASHPSRHAEWLRDARAAVDRALAR